MRAGWVVALAALLGGCAGEGGATGEPDAFGDLEPTHPDRGLIRGVVVDQAIQPVPEARVVARPGGLEATNDGEGAFTFTDLEPGVYFLTASAPHHATAQTSVEVEAGVGRPPVVRIAVEALAKPVPAVQEFQYRFVTSASAWVGAVGGIVVTDVMGDGHFSHTFEMAANTSWVQAELTWAPQQPLAKSMRLSSELSAQEASASTIVTGPSPLLMVYDDDTVPGQDELRLDTTIFIHNGDLPAGVAINQDADLILHAFQHFLPEPGWRFSSDGAHPVPSPP